MARCMGALSGSRVPQAFSGWSAFMAARITHCMLSSYVYGPFDPRDAEAAFADRRPTGTARPDSAGTTALFRRELLGSYVAIGVTLLAMTGFVVEGGARLTSLAGGQDDGDRGLPEKHAGDTGLPGYRYCLRNPGFCLIDHRYLLRGTP